MKRTPLKKVSKQPISKIQRQIWEEVKRLIRRDYKNECYTCRKKGLEGSNWHSGHLWAKASLGAYMKYDLRVIRPQCYHCNINLGGAGAEFYKRMLKEEGQAYMDKLERDRQVSVKAYDFYVELLEYYKSI